MQVQVAQLRDVLAILKPAVPRKSNLPVLSNILVKDGQLVATDMDTMVIIDMPEADGSFLFPYAEVMDMLKYVQARDYLTMQHKRGELKLTWSEGEATYPSEDVQAYPDIPAFEPQDEADVDGDSFIPALVAALPYASTDPARGVLCGVTAQFGKPIEVSAGDGFRMAHIVLPLMYPVEHTAIIPAGSVSVLSHVMAKTQRQPDLVDALVPTILSKRWLRVAFDGKRGMRVVVSPTVSLIVKLIEGQPPSWLKIIPKEEPILTASLFARELETAVRRVSNVAHQNKGMVRLQFHDGAAIISAKAEGREVSAKITAIDLMGAPNRFALDVKYLTEYLKDKDSIVRLSWTGNMAPVALEHGKSPKVLIMPMNAEWGNDLGAPQREPEAVADPPGKPAQEAPKASHAKTRRQPKKKT